MKFCLVVCAILAVAYADLSPKEVYKKFHEECKTATGTDSAEIAKVLKGEAFDGKVLGPHLFCMNKKFGSQNENGDINIEGYKKTLQVYTKDADQIQKVVTACAVRAEGASAEETAVNVARCTVKNVKLVLSDKKN